MKIKLNDVKASSQSELAQQMCDLDREARLSS